MNIGLVGIIVVFAAFIILLIINPRLSCFGRRIASPLHPLMRKKKLSRTGRRSSASTAPGQPGRQGAAKTPDKRTEDYGFHLDK